ncbi:MAG TPA: hypothetical protein VM513_33715 [Kofleriaceae bacterium]|jgi:hypothetical protein|nr:hypothetical protein [Kofleriaceae bacterium]
MASSDLALTRARRAYERAYILAGLRGLAIAAGVTVLAVGLHRVTSTGWLFAALLAATLGALGWRGGAWKRGAFAGLIAGLPPLVVPSIVFAMTTGGHCTGCAGAAEWPCLLSCFVTSSLVGLVVGHRASTDASPRLYASAAIVTASLTGLLGCGTTGLGGALGVVIGLIAGGVTGWVVADRSAHV